MTIMTIIGGGVASAVVPFGPTALAAGVVLGGILLVTTTVVIVADACAAISRPMRPAAPAPRRRRIAPCPQ